MSNVAYKYRMYPNAIQQQFFMKSFGCCRKIWNLMLSDIHSDLKRGVSYSIRTPASYKTAYPYLKEVDSLALANVQMTLKEALSRYRNKKSRFPNFKSRNKSRFSYTTNSQKGSVHIKDSFIKLPKIGYVKIVVHRGVPDDYVLKSATVSMERDGSFYVSVLYEYERSILCKTLVKGLGLDYSSSHLYVDSNGNMGKPEKAYRKYERRLGFEQHKLSRKVKGSHNYEKQRLRVAKCHRHICNVRNDSLHKESTKIANSYDFVCVESLNMRTLANKGFRNGKATLDNGYGRFLSMLEYKLDNRGKILVRIDKFYPSSQLCHVCGYKNPEVKDLKIRKWTCPCCNTYHDRDVNAAKNILNEGIRLMNM